MSSRRPSSSPPPRAQNRVQRPAYPTIKPPLPSPTVRARRRARRRRRQRTALLCCGLALLLGGSVFAWRRRQSKTPSLTPHISANAFTVAAEKKATRQKCDVAVIGGTPSGVAAALSAARAGAKVILVEPHPLLGGDMTYAWINQFDVPIRGIHSEHSPIDYGIFSEFYHELGLAFPPEKARAFIEQKIRAEPNIRVLTSTKVEHINLEEGRLTGALLRVNDEKWIHLDASAWVDATNDADIAAKAGSGYFLGREQANPDRAMQAAGLFFKLKNVRWNSIREYVRGTKAVPLSHEVAQKVGLSTSTDAKVEGNKIVLRLGGGYGPYAWERGDVIKSYKPHGQNIELLSINFGRTGPREAILNTLNVLNTNGLTRFSRDQRRLEAVEELNRLVPYLQKNMPGLEHAELAGVAPELYIRETRHISGLTKLTAEDVKSSRLFPDRIALCSYSMDLHPYKKHERILSGTKRWVFTLPLTSMIPLRVDGLFVASRSLSATWMAAGAARVIPVTVAAGQAAGLCAAMCAQQGMSPQEFAATPEKIVDLQEALRNKGVDVGDNALSVAKKASGAQLVSG